MFNGTDTGLPTVTLTLKDSAGATVATTQTASDGSFSFTNLVAGAYTLVESQPSGYFSRTNAAGNLGGSIGGDTISAINVTAGDAGTGYLFGEVLPVTIGNFVWNDLNGDGLQDAGEPGLNGVTLTLSGTTGAGVGVTQTATTSGNGRYLFTAAPGTYTVSINNAQARASRRSRRRRPARRAA